MGVDDEFERVRTALRAEEQAMAQEFERSAAKLAAEWTMASVMAKIAVEMTEE